jgi:hypothetical protein
MATAALVCGIVGLVMCWAFVPSMVALVLGLIAASRAKQTSDPRAGLGRARAGWIMGAVGIALFVVFIAAAIADLDEDSVGVFELDVGDCVDVPTDSGRTEVQELGSLDCGRPHDAEVFAVDDLTIGDDDYPGETVVTAAVEEACTGPAFREYVGRSYAESALEVYYLYPVEQSWERADDREYVCLAITVDDSPLTGSVQGSGR